ncbi:serendipity locus protein H-1 isoform X2 [Neoarius graeffei]|uniref:serendipity locus protein H-1 isoform X2 n=1 Tax=Neoarius graeffei TaxID=443677 RepID=UPI00298BD7B6|nr:serendipity locus protein H-1 isoform X2 [Neoarius graeffei]
MSSELTIDIQLTELGFSSWDFQVLKQKETNQTSDPGCASSSSCPIPVGQIPPVCPNFLPNNHDSGVNARLVHVDSTETSAGDSSKTVCEKESELMGEKRRKYPWYDENADEQLKEDKKKKIHKEQEVRERGDQRKLISDDDDDQDDDDDVVSGEEDEEEEDDGLTDDEESDDALSSDTNGSEEHRCQVCSLTFSTTFLLHEHLHIHNGVRLYHCAECSKQFCHLANYRKHLRCHAQAATIRCVICTAHFRTQDDLQHHLETNHFEDKFYQCDLCKRIFTSMAECKKHVQTHKRRAKRYPCPKCECSFRHHSAMLYHLKRHKKGMFICTDCGLAFSTKAVLLRHSFHHLGVLPYTCIRCKRHFRLSTQYMKHECKPQQLQCVACLVIFWSQEDFLKHKKDTGCWGHQTALGAKANVIRCMECGQVFNSSEELKKHAGMHKRVMRCSECGMGFRSSIMLMSHMGGHAAQRPCLCQECGLGFCHQQAYESHLKTCGLVNPAEIGTKKQKPNAEKKEVVIAPKIKEIVPQLVHLPPAAVIVTKKQNPNAEKKEVVTIPKSKEIVPQLVHLPPAAVIVTKKQNPNAEKKEVVTIPKSKEIVPQLVHLPPAAVIVTKKQNPNAEKKEVVIAPKSKEIVPQLVHLPPAAVVSGQTKPAEGLTTFTLNKEPLSPLPLVMFLPAPSASASDSIQNPQKLNSDVSNECLSAPQVIHIPLPSNNSSVHKECEKSVLLKDIASPVPGSNILIPLTSVENGKTGWTLLEAQCASGSITKIYTIRKENGQVTDITLERISPVPQVNASSEQKKKGLSNLEIAQILHLMKKNVCSVERKENRSNLTIAISDNTDDEKQSASRLRNRSPSLQKSADAQLTTNTESECLGAEKMQPCPDFDTSTVILDSSQVKRQLEEDQIPKSSIHSSSRFLNSDEISSQNNVQKTHEHLEEEDLGLDCAVIELGDESDTVQCETCGRMVLERDLVQHTITHGLDCAVIELDDESDVMQCETCGRMVLEKDLVQHMMTHSVSSVLATS